MTEPRQTDFIVQLRPRSSVDAIFAVKQLLKIASRRLGLRCISVTEVRPADTDTRHPITDKASTDQ